MKNRYHEADLANWKHVEQFLSQELVVPVVAGDVGYQLRHVVGPRPGYDEFAISSRKALKFTSHTFLSLAF